MTGDELKKELAEAGGKASAWSSAHPEIMKALAYIAVGIAVGFVLFH